jgi:HYDIN/CFA65/VesB family protein/ASPM-SPD-2-Hydin domain-containing protein
VVIFGSNADSVTQTITLTNRSTQDACITGKSMDGSNPGDFVIQNDGCNGKIAPQGSCQLTVAFSPAAAGSRSATLTLNDNAANSPQSTSMFGTGFVGSLGIAPKTLNFGTVNMSGSNPSVTKSFVITNRYDVPITIQDFSNSNSDYSVSQSCVGQLVKGSPCSVEVTFSPSTNGRDDDVIQISDDASGSPQSVNVKGRGDTPHRHHR